MSKKIGKLICCFLVLVTAISLIPVSAIEKGDLENPINYIGNDTNQGDVKLTKTVSTIDKDKGIYNVKFDLSSKDATKVNNNELSLYAVIVFDTSGSMCEKRYQDCGDKWKNALNGAINFSKDLLKNVKTANIALVNFSSNAQLKRGFSSSPLKESDFNTPNGGTNIAEGLSSAQNILDGITNQNAKKYIILMSDGEPEVYTTIGKDHKAIKEAKETATNIKNKKIELFAVGYDTTTSNANFLKAIVSIPSSKYYADGEINNIKEKFNNIVETISKFPAAQNITITDILGDAFTYVENSKSKGVTVNDKNITYTIDKSTENGSSFNFNIQIDNKSKTGWYDTNNNASIKYTDSLGEEINKTIEKSAKVYWKSPKYNYVINYYKDNLEEENFLDKINGTGEYNEEITIDTSYKIPKGYHYSGEDTSFIIKEKDNIINIIYSKKNDLSYCVNYFYDGIIDINKTECFYGQPYGKNITSFIDKPKDGFIFESFDPITILDKEENIMNVYYKKLPSGEIIPPKTGITRVYGVIGLTSAIATGFITYIIKRKING